MSAAYVDAVGVLAPGLPSWSDCASVLRGAAPYQSAAIAPVHTSLLPPNERRRAPLAVRMALRAAEDVMSGAATVSTSLASVFSTSDADTEIVHRICSALAEPERQVSPTDFHNSVHNAAAGYWSIACAARGASTTIAAYDFGLAAGLREALAMLSVDETDVLFVLYDVPPPVPLHAKRPIAQPAAIALLLTQRPSERSLGKVALCEASGETAMTDPELEALRHGNPALRALPMLELLAKRSSGVVGIRASHETLMGIRLEAS